MQKKKRLLLMQEIARKRGGKCLSEEYRNVTTPLLWECAEGHRWKATPDTIKNGASWCRPCSYKARGAARLAYTVDDMRALAAKRGGLCLSEEYTHAHLHLRWRCGSGHEWSATPDKVLRGRWCPHCGRYGSSRGERVARLVLEAMFGVRLPRTRPMWLRAPTGRPLELDGYSPDARLAFEYHGSQHYEPSTRHTAEWVKRQQERDRYKAGMCSRQGISLVVVPPFTDPNNLPGCIDQVDHAVLWAGLRPPRKWPRPTSLEVIFEPLERLFGMSSLRELQSLAGARGGALASTSAQSANTLRWRCAQGHEWVAPAYSIRAGYWCKRCAGQGPRSLDDLRARAAAMGGHLLSTEYAGVKSHYRWRCGMTHEWTATGGSVLRGSWCPHCYKLRRRARRLPEG